jgi:ubiquinone/menaquinone biosynthesis C-methylase UbiE
MSLRVWDERVVPRLTDLSLRGHEVGEMREVACAGMSGRVLEIGFGSGLNVRWYPPEVTSVTAIEPSDLGWELSGRRRARTAVRIERAGLDGQRLDLLTDSHDCALITFSLCTIPDPLLALRESRRVVRDGGRLHALEHGLAPDESVRRWQRRLEPVQRAVAGGCHLTRDIPALVEQAGWQVEELEQSYLPGPGMSRPWTYGYRLVAV